MCVSLFRSLCVPRVALKMKMFAQFSAQLHFHYAALARLSYLIQFCQFFSFSAFSFSCKFRWQLRFQLVSFCLLILFLSFLFFLCRPLQCFAAIDVVAIIIVVFVLIYSVVRFVLSTYFKCAIWFFVRLMQHSKPLRKELKVEIFQIFKFPPCRLGAHA